MLSVLKKLNRELGLTVIIAEHRLECPVADGSRRYGTRKNCCLRCARAVGKRRLINKNHPMLAALPSAVRIYSALEGFSETCPLTVREGRDFLEKNFAPAPNAPLPSDEPDSPAAEKDKTPAVELKNVWFRYERDLPDVLRATCLKAYSGEIFCLLGGNGVGKTTTLNVIAGLNRAYRGKTLINGTPITKFKGNSLYRKNIALLPQDPQTVFVRDEVQKDLEELAEACGLSKPEREKRISEISEKLGITPFLKNIRSTFRAANSKNAPLPKRFCPSRRYCFWTSLQKGLTPFRKRPWRRFCKR